MAKKQSSVGNWAFLLGVLIAIIVGIFGNVFSWVGLVLLVLGLIVGFMNIKTREVTGFLIASIALLAVSSAAGLTEIDMLLPSIGTYVASIVSALVAFVAPAALVIALKEIYMIAARE